MDYTKHYSLLIERAKNRNQEGYTEKHRILPGCMGGKYNKNNVVLLTAEEHYVAHQLLVKIYPTESGLVSAANIMTVKSKNQERSKNKQYSWLKKKYLKICKARIGNKNPSYGTCWITKDTKNKKIKKEELKNWRKLGWKKGRWYKKQITSSVSSTCNYCAREILANNKRFYCNTKCYDAFRCPLKGRELEFLQLYEKYNSMNKALKEMGYPGAISHYYKWAKKVLKK